VTYHGQYFTINSHISECDHKCETQNAEPEIGTDGSSQTRRNPRVDGYGSGFGTPRVCGSGFWPVLEPNRPVFAVQTRTAGGLPGPVANTTDGHLLGITTDNASSNYLMTRKLQSTLEASGIEWPALWNHIQCMAHVIQLALGAFMSSLGVKGRTKSWEAHECNQQFGENESSDIERSQRLQKKDNARINYVSAMRPDLAKIIEKVHIS